ncbi:MAG: winged helix DNA-binding domain-containing protein [Gemmatimonadota bacterium]
MMTPADIVWHRLRNQGIAEPIPGGPGEVVGWLGGVQAQDYLGAKWALGLRLEGAADHDIERAFNDGAILRTHLLRPTWHFVTPIDIRWMLALTAPRVHAANGPRYRQLELDSGVFQLSNEAIAKALQGGQHLTRDELRGVLQRAGIETDREQRMAYLMMRAELDGIVCSGPRRGKQFTYALLDERAPRAGALGREEALAELARRYFASRGPATVHDFAKWSGLILADARSGLEAVEAGLRHEVADGRTCWFPRSRRSKADGSPTAHLLSIYDEYVSGYKDRSAMIDERHAARLSAMGNALNYIVVVDGRIVGTWRRTLGKTEVVIQTDVFARLTRAQREAVAAAADRYGAFLGRSVVLTV